MATQYQIHQSLSERRTGQTLWQKIWQDRRGRTVIYQRPNVWLIAWAVCDLVAIFVSSKRISGIAWAVGAGFLIIWSLLELAQGANYFRRALGLVVLLVTVGSIFRVL